MEDNKIKEFILKNKNFSKFYFKKNEKLKN